LKPFPVSESGSGKTGAVELLTENLPHYYTSRKIWGEKSTQREPEPENKIFFSENFIITVVLLFSSSYFAATFFFQIFKRKI